MPDRPAPPPNLVATPLQRELDRVLSARGAEREKALLGSRNLRALVGMIPPEELFFTLAEMDPGDVPLVLAHARTEQVTFMLDLELWRKDRLRHERVAPWLEQLAACGEPVLARWLGTLET
jgi:hypothetical protein